MFGFYVFNWQVMVALEVSAHLAAATAEIKRWLTKIISLPLDVNDSKIKIISCWVSVDIMLLISWNERSWMLLLIGLNFWCNELLIVIEL